MSNEQTSASHNHYHHHHHRSGDSARRKRRLTQKQRAKRIGNILFAIACVIAIIIVTVCIWVYSN